MNRAERRGAETSRSGGHPSAGVNHAGRHGRCTGPGTTPVAVAGTDRDAAIRLRVERCSDQPRGLARFATGFEDRPFARG